jgi:hypothetical protein
LADMGVTPQKNVFVFTLLTTSGRGRGKRCHAAFLRASVSTRIPITSLSFMIR